MVSNDERSKRQPATQSTVRCHVELRALRTREGAAKYDHGLQARDRRWMIPLSDSCPIRRRLHVLLRHCRQAARRQVTAGGGTWKGLSLRDCSLSESQASPMVVCWPSVWARNVRSGAFWPLVSPGVSVRSRARVIFMNSGDRSSPRAIADGDMSYLVGASSGLGRSDSARLASASYLAAI